MEALELELTYPDKSRYRLTDPLSEIGRAHV